MRGRPKKDLSRPIMMVLDRGGPLSTGEICDLLSVLAPEPLTETKPVQHGRNRQGPRMIKGTNVPGNYWEVCPNCDCTEEREVSRPYMAPRVRAALKKLTRRGQVVEISTETPNNKGGHLWLRADQVNEYYGQLFE
jgi:hypothetical protein